MGKQERDLKPRRWSQWYLFQKNIGVVLYHLVLCLSLPIATQADEYKKFDSCAEIPGRQPDPVKCGEKPQQGLHTITGEILQLWRHLNKLEDAERILQAVCSKFTENVNNLDLSEAKTVLQQLRV